MCLLKNTHYTRNLQVSYIQPAVLPIKIKTFITGLAVTPLGHAVNQLAFTHSGKLLIAAGGVTNAGIGSPRSGFLDVRSN